jgi:hypothetical protein
VAEILRDPPRLEPAAMPAPLASQPSDDQDRREQEEFNAGEYPFLFGAGKGLIRNAADNGQGRQHEIGHHPATIWTCNGFVPVT